MSPETAGTQLSPNSGHVSLASNRSYQVPSAALRNIERCQSEAGPGIAQGMQRAA